MMIELIFENFCLQLTSKADMLAALRIEVDIVKTQLYRYFS